MSGRTILVNQVWEHWATKKRLRIKEVEFDGVKVDRTDNHEGTYVLLDKYSFATIVKNYIYIGELEQP